MNSLFASEQQLTNDKRAVVTHLAARLAALAIALAVGATSTSSWWFWSVGALFLVTALSLALVGYQDDEPSARQHWINLAIDTAVVSFVVMVTGGFESFASLLYLPLSMITTLGKDTRHSYRVAAIMTSAFASAGVGSLIIVPDGGAFSLNAALGSVFVIGLIWSSQLLVRRIQRGVEEVQRFAAEHATQVGALQHKHAESVARIKALEQELELHELLARRVSEQSRPQVAQKLLDDAASLLVAKSQIMQKLQSLVVRVAPSDATVLVSGESGTGKEVVARAIHELSTRAKGPFVAVNCGAIPEHLLESELFGHKKGAFTGAVSDSIGLFRKAAKGTIFLDEIGELPLQMQVKLLRAIQERQVHPVGSENDIEIDVRIIAATNKDLRACTRNGSFREDLFFRLNVVSLSLPPLRDRKEDVPELIEKLLARITNNSKMIQVSPQAFTRLLAYNYPGNVRELENVLSRAVVFGGDIILPEHLPEMEGTVPAARTHTEIYEDPNLVMPVRLDDILGTLEKKFLLAALEKTSGAKKKAADLLGMNFRSFRYRLQKFDIESEDPPEA